MDEIFKRRHSVRNFQKQGVEESRVKDILGIKEDWHPVALLPLGYSAE